MKRKRASPTCTAAFQARRIGLDRSIARANSRGKHRESLVSSARRVRRARSHLRNASDRSPSRKGKVKLSDRYRATAAEASWRRGDLFAFLFLPAGIRTFQFAKSTSMTRNDERRATLTYRRRSGLVRCLLSRTFARCYLCFTIYLEEYRNRPEERASETREHSGSLLGASSVRDCSRRLRESAPTRPYINASEEEPSHGARRHFTPLRANIRTSWFD